jgi:hypothetical protein
LEGMSSTGSYMKTTCRWFYALISL